MRVARRPQELGSRPRAVAIGTFDGVHVGHQAVVRAAVDTGPLPTVVTFHPHPREVLGYQVSLLSTLERRLELLAALGVEETLVVEFTPQVAALEPEEFARAYLEAIGAERRIEAFLLDFQGDLYGERLIVELWDRLRDERAFTSEAEHVEQIARDVEATRAATRP